jgi:hypothetical protein
MYPHRINIGGLQWEDVNRAVAEVIEVQPDMVLRNKERSNSANNRKKTNWWYYHHHQYHPFVRMVHQDPKSHPGQASPHLRVGTHLN